MMKFPRDWEVLLVHPNPSCAKLCKNIGVTSKTRLTLFSFTMKQFDFTDMSDNSFPPEFEMTEEQLKEGLGAEFQNLPEEYFEKLSDKIIKKIDEIRRAKIMP